MYLKITLVAIAAALALPGCAQKHYARNCENAIEIAYRFTERAIEIHPELAYSPVRNNTDSAIFWLACRDGLRNGIENDSERLATLYNHIAEAITEKDISIEEGRYLVDDMAIYLAYRYGYELAGT